MDGQKKLTGILVSCVVLIITAGLVALILSQNGASQNVKLSDATLTTDWATGTPKAALTLVEYSDFQCPACSAREPVVRSILADFGSKILFVYRHFPLPQHGNARAAAAAAEAAGAQGKFWEMHDALFNHQNDWADASDPKTLFDSYAQALGLDLAKFDHDLAAPETAARVEQASQSGVRSQVDATPTFFLNGARVDDPYAAVKAAL